MIKKNLENFLIILLFGLGMISCAKKFLNPVPNTQLSDATFWKSIDDANMALAGCYRGWENGMNIVMGDAMTDNDYSWLAVTGYQQVGNGTVNPQGVLLGTGAQVFSYAQIRKYNNFLEHMDKMDIDSTVKNELKAEVRFL